MAIKKKRIPKKKVGEEFNDKKKIKASSSSLSLLTNIAPSKDIRNEIRKNLDQRKNISASGVKISVSPERIVTLEGYVDSLIDKKRIFEITTNVPGVVEIKDKIQVVRESDEEIK